jgi:hypothetical protein
MPIHFHDSQGRGIQNDIWEPVLEDTLSAPTAMAKFMKVAA